MVPALVVWTQGVHAVSWRAPAAARRSKVRAGSSGRQAGSHASTSGPTWMSWTSGRAHNQGATLARWSFVVLPRHLHEDRPARWRSPAATLQAIAAIASQINA